MNFKVGDRVIRKRYNVRGVIAKISPTTGMLFFVPDANLAETIYCLEHELDLDISSRIERVLNEV